MQVVGRASIGQVWLTVSDGACNNACGAETPGAVWYQRG
jgi:hypothetical protein